MSEYRPPRNRIPLLSPLASTPKMIHGIASSERIVDRSGDGSDNVVLLARGATLVTPLPLLYEHRGDRVGEVVHLRWLGSQLYCRAIISNRELWREIEEVRLRALSCSYVAYHHETRLDARAGVVKHIDRYRITEISVVTKALNQDCHFRIFSGAGEMSVAGQRSLSEHRRINAKARATLARLDAKDHPCKDSKVENSDDDEWMTSVERRRFDSWFKKMRNEP
jgi:hypothetical protein